MSDMSDNNNSKLLSTCHNSARNVNRPGHNMQRELYWLSYTAHTRTRIADDKIFPKGWNTLVCLAVMLADSSSKLSPTSCSALPWVSSYLTKWRRWRRFTGCDGCDGYDGCAGGAATVTVVSAA